MVWAWKCAIFLWFFQETCGGIWRVKLEITDAIIDHVTLNICERRYKMIGIYDCFGYGSGYAVSFEERHRGEAKVLSGRYWEALLL